jgi:hypothetical protein
MGRSSVGSGVQSRQEKPEGEAGGSRALYSTLSYRLSESS